MDFNKKISKKGSVSIPAALRRQFGIDGGEKVNIQVKTNGDIVLKRIIGSCILCGADEELKVLNGKYICKGCREAVSGL